MAERATSKFYGARVDAHQRRSRRREEGQPRRSSSLRSGGRSLSGHVYTSTEHTDVCYCFKIWNIALQPSLQAIVYATVFVYVCLCVFVCVVVTKLYGDDTLKGICIISCIER